MARTPIPQDLHFTDAPRPTRTTEEPIPEPVLAGLRKTATTQRAIRISTEGWTDTVRNAIYRRILALNRDEHFGFGVYGRKEADALYFWATRRRRRTKRAGAKHA